MFYNIKSASEELPCSAASFKEVLKKYQKLSEVHTDMDAEDVGIQRTSAMVVKDLEDLLKVFQTGE